MDGLPGGTVTFFFSDIEGSTRLAESLGAAWVRTLADHRRLLREVFAAHGGTEFGTAGDSFFVAFPRAADAVAAALDGQRALAAHRWPDRDVRVRMGVHTTDVDVDADGYVGLGVHRAARVCSAAHGGQVLVSGATAAVTGAALPAGADLRTTCRCS